MVFPICFNGVNRRKTGAKLRTIRQGSRRAGRAAGARAQARGLDDGLRGDERPDDDGRNHQRRPRGGSRSPARRKDRGKHMEEAVVACRRLPDRGPDPSPRCEVMALARASDVVEHRIRRKRAGRRPGKNLSGFSRRKATKTLRQLQRGAGFYKPRYTFVPGVFPVTAVCGAGGRRRGGRDISFTCAERARCFGCKPPVGVSSAEG